MSNANTSEDVKVNSSRAKDRFGQSRTFLSGEGDKELQSRQQKGLREIVAVSSNPERDFGNEVTASKTGGRVCIEVVGEASYGDESSDDDEPPPISTSEATISARVASEKAHSDPSLSQSGVQPNSLCSKENCAHSIDAPSLMDEMMAEAAKARNEKTEKNDQKQRKDTKSASFGMKKGFLNSGAKKGKKKQLSKSPTGTVSDNRIHLDKGKNDEKKGLRKGFLDSSKRRQSSRKESDDRSKPKTKDDDIFELDSDGNLVKASPPVEEIPTIRPRDKRNQSTGRDTLRFEEVQEAMRNSPAEKLAGGEWVNESLMQKVAENPRLAAGLNNPKFTAALQALQKNPREAMAKFKNQPEIADFLHEFCGVMGEHFTKLGEEQDQKRKSQSGNQRDVDKIGPLAQEALKKETKRQSKGGTLSDGMSREERKRMDSILADEELTSILMDSDMQRVMQECALPGRMQHFMNHPSYGQKLRRLMAAGLLKEQASAAARIHHKAIDSASLRELKPSPSLQRA
eukprot:CAMPEP_0113546676 /NCGR_PEP_ID=MMETSP0015_2-20120614/11936_1 /TAXON_ID=2838 /ORGANISM="Odontella" /LENGTH=513 /DNA_ID=CAMNT_0000447153 /DNA_START=83 /DNA_END=1625 /DNA_ORIENTATION=+ /assembly_acc=CAM_ASM_000160